MQYTWNEKYILANWYYESWVWFAWTTPKLKTINVCSKNNCIGPLCQVTLSGNSCCCRFESQEKFPNSHFGFKKGNNWDLKGSFLGKPKIEKVLPKPFMDQENPILIPTMGFFRPNFNPRMGIFCTIFSPVLGLNIPIVIPIMGFFHPNFYPGMGFFCTIFSPILGLNIPILIPTMGFFVPIFIQDWVCYVPFLPQYWDWPFPFQSQQWDFFVPSFIQNVFFYHVFSSIGIQHSHSNPNNGICCPIFIQCFFCAK